MDNTKKPWFKALFRHRILIAFLLLVQLFLIVLMIINGTRWSTNVQWILSGISVLVAIHVVSQSESSPYKLVLVFMVLMFPLFGGLFYLIFFRQKSTRGIYKQISDIKTQTKSSYLLKESSFERAISIIPEYKNQLYYLQNTADFPVYSNTKSTYLPLGEVKFEHLLAELEKAEKYIFLEYFILEPGKMFDGILEVLRRKARQGVLVRLIYDDFGCFFLLPKDFTTELKKDGIDAVVFNPFRPMLQATLNNRDHRKIAVIDGKVAFTGGINLADEYINAYEKYGHWKDCAIKLEGDGAWSFTLMFLEMWELCTGQKENVADYFPEKSVNDFGIDDSFVQPYSDCPLDDESVSEKVYMHMISGAKDYLYINTPYLIVDDSILSALILAAKSGVDVRIVTPHKWDKKLIHITTRSYFPQLIEGGVKIYEYSRGFMHSKSFVSDDKSACIGTVNLDFRSLYLHFECGVWVANSPVVLDVKNDFLTTLEVCKKVELEDCKVGFFTKALQSLLRLLAPVM